MSSLLFKNATIVDGTGAQAYPADLLVRGERIAAIGNLADAQGERVIPASDLVLCPGFVDIHGHSDYFLLVLPSAEGKVKQGVTTEVGGNCGYSAAPVRGELARDRRQSHRELYGLDADWESFEQYLERLERARPAINFAPLVGFNTVRGSVMGLAAGPAPSEALLKMRDLIRESLAQGAFGISLGLIYAPGCFAGTDELAECAQEAASVGGLVASHIRSEGDRLIEAIQESLEIAERSGARFQVSHLKTSGSANWDKLPRVFELIEGARERGLDVAADRYPYLASFTQLSAALPEWVFEGGKEEFLARVRDPATRDRIRRELAGQGAGEDRWERIVVAQVFHPELSRYEGQSVAEGARQAGLDPLDFLCWIVAEARDRVAAIYHTMSMDNLERIYQKDWVMVGSDAAVRTHQGVLAEGKPHPRAYGTMPRVLAWAVREKAWLDLPAAVRKMTHDPCRRLGIADRGVIREGAYADLVLLDPRTVQDRATYDFPQQYPEGIEMVVVNGKVTVEKGELTGERAGRVLTRT